MGDFIATPFFALAQVFLWCGALINGKPYLLIEVGEDAPITDVPDIGPCLIVPLGELEEDDDLEY